MVHFADNWAQRRVPSRNADKEQSSLSMARIAELLANKAELWINHDKRLAERVPKAPAYLE